MGYLEGVHNLVQSDVLPETIAAYFTVITTASVESTLHRHASDIRMNRLASPAARYTTPCPQKYSKTRLPWEREKKNVV